ncbi:uncharacterized protein P174DRAFT_10673 [Aspergillus novofumigatus IBT 16806]|uniref:Uncharacterized protein n=1 Tax=Aspergillus novofumigatus (strain IBT 16806) TaxID=1392255 RepID=A0A2I1CKW1_ASPN1|nr:uncharacterized protein P174DRAFT_10673 [Aspergillus novofumigatus IBT 16806]PKX98267.1 hypothetical protein P174DRAFT_10673 [Aspergillus novofumigatus IBT 16806]
MSQHYANAESRTTTATRTGTPAYQFHRPASSLLIASKRPLTKPSPVPQTINPSVHPASVTIKSPLSSIATATATTTGTTDRSKAHTVEMNLSQPPQPFLDPGVWERMKAAGGMHQGVQVLRGRKERRREGGGGSARRSLGRWRCEGDWGNWEAEEMIRCRRLD